MKKCPLMSRPVVMYGAQDKPVLEGLVECLRGDCAWYCHNASECAVQDLNATINHVVEQGLYINQ